MSKKDSRDLFVGIDPGKEGFICVYDGDKIRAMWALPYLEDEIDVVALSRMLRALRLKGARIALLERQQPFHKEGPQGAFTNGFGYGALKASLVWSGIPFEVVRPDAWKREMSIPAPKITVTHPPKPSNMGARKAWEKTCKKMDAEVARKRKQARKDLACRKAQQLQPRYDFRSGPRSKKPHEGKCEAFLLAFLAHRRSQGDSA